MTYQPPVVASATLDATAELTPIIQVRGGAHLSVSISGTFSGTIQLRRTLTKDRPTDVTASGIKASWIGSAVPVEEVHRVGATAFFFLYAASIVSGAAVCALRSDYDAPGLFQAEAFANGTLDAVDEVVGPLLVRGGGWISAQRLAGSFSGTVVLERSFDGGSTWAIMDADIINEDVQVGATCLVRARCTAYTSGSASIYLAVGQG